MPAVNNSADPLAPKAAQAAPERASRLAPSSGPDSEEEDGPTAVGARTAGAGPTFASFGVLSTAGVSTGCAMGEAVRRDSELTSAETTVRASAETTGGTSSVRAVGRRINIRCPHFLQVALLTSLTSFSSGIR